MTKPTPGMLAAMAAAEVGDEQEREDPSTNELQRRMAKLLGHEAALFFPPAPMANQAARRASAPRWGAPLHRGRRYVPRAGGVRSALRHRGGLFLEGPRLPVRGSPCRVGRDDRAGVGGGVPVRRRVAAIRYRRRSDGL